MPSTNSVAVDHVGSVNRIASYSAGTQHTAGAEHDNFSIYSVDRHQQAWTNTSNMPSSCAPIFPAQKPPLPPVSHGSNFSETPPQHVLSKKEENLSEEWLVDMIWSDYVIAELLLLSFSD